MVKNYLITTLRSLARNRVFSLLSITGLAVGMAICMGIIRLVADQFNYDRHNVLGDRIFRINTL